jgi:cyclic-di-GMP-binding protein
MLLAAARPNQLRQEEVAATFNALNMLAPLAELEAYQRDGKENLFVVLLDSNRPPFYKSLLSKHQAKEHQDKILELRTSQLAAQLQHQPTDQQEQNSSSKLSAALNQHLITAWTHLSLRSFERTEISSDIEITVGLSNIHFHIAEQQPFNLFLNQVSAIADDGATAPLFKKHNAKLKEKIEKATEDPWEDSFELSDTQLISGSLPSFNLEKKMSSQEQATYQGKHPIFTVPLTDRSPGGYGVEWRSEIPAQVKAGELLGLREQGRSKWAIGVVRWVHQIKGASQLGIQILAPQAVPLGIAIVHKTGGFSEYLRALQIPELRAINQPPSLITNAISFHEYNKARLYQQPQEGVSYTGDRSIQLTRRIFATGAFSQFGFRELIPDTKNSGKTNDDFNSVWES